MKSAVYALAESAIFRISTYHYILGALLIAHLSRLLIRRIQFINKVAWIPGPSALPVVGNALSLMVEQHEFYRLLLRLGEQYGRIFRLWVGTRAFVFLSSAEDVKPILNSMQHIDKSIEYSYLKDWLGSGLITATGLNWQRRRKLLTPAFHWDILQEFAEPITRQVDILMENLEIRSQSKKNFDILPILKACTLDIICVTAMGKEVGAQMDSSMDYTRAIEKISSIVQRRFITPWLKSDFIFKHSKMGKEQEEALQIIHGFVGGVIEARKREKKMGAVQSETGMNGGRRRQAFLDLVLDANDNGAALSDQDLVDEVNTFMFAGHDTSATAIAWCLYVFGKYPEVQERIVQEYREKGAEGNAYDRIKNLPYLEICIKEVHRMYPVTPLIARNITQDVQLSGGRILPAGTTVLIHSPMLHREPKHYQNPNEFQPERFEQDSQDAKHPFSYIPFSAGPRNCIGQKFAQMTTKLILTKILDKFAVVSPVPESELNLVSDIVLTNKEGILIGLTPRI